LSACIAQKLRLRAEDYLNERDERQRGDDPDAKRA
jgi:hypothetical protein